VIEDRQTPMSLHGGLAKDMPKRTSVLQEKKTSVEPKLYSTDAHGLTARRTRNLQSLIILVNKCQSIACTWNMLTLLLASMAKRHSCRLCMLALEPDQWLQGPTIPH